MKTRSSVAMFLLVGLLLVTGSRPASGQWDGPQCSFNEDGAGWLVLTPYGGPTEPNYVVSFSGSLAPDPTQATAGGLSVPVLTFQLPPLAWNCPCGDVEVWEPYQVGINTYYYLGDDLRFTDPAGDMGPGGPFATEMIFYSLPGEGDVADTGLPSEFINPVSSYEDMSEQFGFGWGQENPLYAYGDQQAYITFLGVSGPGTPQPPTAAPEPSALLLFTVGVVTLLAFGWSRRRRAA